MALLCADATIPVIGMPGAAFDQAWTLAFVGMEAVTVTVVADNDPAGGAFRRRCDELLSPVVGAVIQFLVPSDFNDLDEWRRDDLDHFAAVIQAARSPNKRVGTMTDNMTELQGES